MKNKKNIFIPKLNSTVKMITYCAECRIRQTYWCVRRNHKEIKRPNTPFIIPDLQVKRVGKWVKLKSEKMDKSFELAPTKFQEVILGCGVEPGGAIKNQWWIISNVGGSQTLQWLGSKDGKFVPK